MDAERELDRRRIRRAIDHRGFQVVYQPIVNIDSGEVTGVEALSRFRDGRPPLRWFEESELVGMAAELDLAIIETALTDLPDLPPGYLALNLSPSTLLEPRLQGLLESAGPAVERLVVEITEHKRVANYGQARKALDALRDAGVHLAIDDAGAGYATFRHVLRLRPDIIKMDMSITQHIDRDQARAALATALVIFASEIGAVVIAEGVETTGELNALHAAGVSRAQGFALARPQSLPLVLPIGRRAGPGRRMHDVTRARTTVSAHELLSPVGGLELALEMLRKKSEEKGEESYTALVSAAQRQARFVGDALQDLARGLSPSDVINLSEFPVDTAVDTETAVNADDADVRHG